MYLKTRADIFNLRIWSNLEMLRWTKLVTPFEVYRPHQKYRQKDLDRFQMSSNRFCPQTRGSRFFRWNTFWPKQLIYTLRINMVDDTIRIKYFKIFLKYPFWLIWSKLKWSFETDFLSIPSVWLNTPLGQSFQKFN